MYGRVMGGARCGAPARWSLARVLAQRYAAPAFATALVTFKPGPPDNTFHGGGLWIRLRSIANEVTSFISRARFGKLASVMLAAASVLHSLPLPRWWKTMALLTVFAIAAVHLQATQSE